MGLSVRWKDSRMRLYRNWLSLNGDKRIWSPEIVIWSPMVSQVNNGEVYVTQDSGGILVSKDLSLNTQVKCEMVNISWSRCSSVCCSVLQCAAVECGVVA